MIYCDVATVNERFAVVFTSQLISVIDKFGCARIVLAVLALFICLLYVGYYEETVDDSGK